jgi:hypothetical protein
VGRLDFVPGRITELAFWHTYFYHMQIIKEEVTQVGERVGERKGG